MSAQSKVYLNGDKLSLHDAKGHLSFGRGAADDRVERLVDLVQAVEGHAEADAVLEVGQSSGDAVEEDADGRGNVFPEGLRVLPVLAPVPKKALRVGQNCK